MPISNTISVDCFRLTTSSSNCKRILFVAACYVFLSSAFFLQIVVYSLDLLSESQYLVCGDGDTSQRVRRTKPFCSLDKTFA